MAARKGNSNKIRRYRKSDGSTAVQAPSGEWLGTEPSWKSTHPATGEGMGSQLALEPDASRDGANYDLAFDAVASSLPITAPSSPDTNGSEPWDGQTPDGDVYVRKFDSPKETTEAYMEEIEKGIEGFEDSEKYKEWLGFCGRFHHYSFNNQMLLMLQTRGQATYVASGKKWAEMGYRMKKGTKALRVLAPQLTKMKEGTRYCTTCRYRLPAAGGNCRCGTPTAAVVGPGGKEFLTGFRAVPVFDAAQIDGFEPPTPYENLSEEPPEGFTEDLVSAIEERGFTVRYENLNRPEYGGHTSPTSREVVINTQSSPASQAKTLAHELAHIALGHLERTHEYHSGPSGSRPEMEIEAESVAYVLCRENGMSAEIGNETFTYVGHWAKSRGNKDADTLMKETTGNITQGVKAILSSRKWRNISHE